MSTIYWTCDFFYPSNVDEMGEKGIQYSYWLSGFSMTLNLNRF